MLLGGGFEFVPSFEGGLALEACLLLGISKPSFEASGVSSIGDTSSSMI